MVGIGLLGTWCFYSGFKKYYNFDSIIKKTDSFFIPKITANPIYTLYFLSGATVMILNGQSRIGTRSADVRQ